MVCLSYRQADCNTVIFDNYIVRRPAPISMRVFPSLAVCDTDVLRRPHWKAGNHPVISSSQMHANASGRDNSIASVKTHGPSDMVKDNTR
jgi:uncharacterized protein YegP (UPF0339 family)